MKTLFQIVFYYDRYKIHKIVETKILFDDERTAIMIADNVCKQKKIFFDIKEFYV